MAKEIDKVRAKRLAACSELYRPALAQSYNAALSPRGAIKAFCISCVGYIRADVTNCQAFGCPLWEYRPYQAKDKEDE